MMPKKPFESLSPESKQKVRDYAIFYEDILNRRTFLVNKEAKIQLVYQNVLIIYQVKSTYYSANFTKIQFFRFPMTELLYKESDFLGKVSPSSRWIGGILLQVLTSVTSSLSATLSVVKVDVQNIIYIIKYINIDKYFSDHEI